MSTVSLPAAPELPPQRLLGRADARTLALSSLGGALEFYDFIIFVFYAKLISEQFFPAQLDPFWAMLNTWGIFAAGYFFRPLGGVVMAHFGDLVGRKRTFMLSILMMALPTLAIGLLPTYASIGLAAPLLLLVMRMVQGIAIGGEIPAAWTFVSEHVPPRHVGLANGTLCMGLNVGILLGSLMALCIQQTFGEAEIRAWAWRIPFLVGGLLGFLTMYLRMWLHETPVFREIRERKQLYPGVPLKAVLTAHRGAVVLGILMTWVLTACIMVALLATPQLMSGVYKIPKATTFAMQSWAILAAALGCALMGHLCDRFGIGRMLALMAAAEAVVCYWFFTSLGHASLGTIAFWYVLMGLLTGLVAAVPMVLVESFPAPVRLSGVSFSYNMCYAVCGGVTFPLITVLGRYTEHAAMYYLLAVCVLAFGCGLYLMGRLPRSWHAQA